jgi:hypothetical protein
MYGDAIKMAQFAHAERERGYQRAMGDPELAWLIDEHRRPAGLAVDLRGARRGLQAVVLAVFGRS